MRERGPVRRLFRIGRQAPDARDAVDWEVEHHLAEMRDRLVAEGRDPDHARLLAERRFGRLEAHRRVLARMERRRLWRMKASALCAVLLETTWDSVRNLSRQPGSTLTIAVTLGVGVGANVTMFGILDRILFQPPAHVVEHERVRRVMVERRFDGEWFEQPIGTFRDLLDMREHRGFAGIAGFDAVEMTLRNGSEARKVRAVLAEHTLFPLLGVSAGVGRLFTADDDRSGAQPVAVLSYEYWRRSFGGDAGALGATIELDGTPFTVVGIAPEGFTGTDIAPVDVWIPLQVGGDLELGVDSWRESRGLYWLQAVARLHPEVALAAAQEEATALHRAGRSEQIEQGRYDPGARVVLEPLILAQGSGADAASRVARWLGGVSLLLLAIVCANIANLLLARGTGRVREVAVRLALGISRRRLVAGALLETILLGLLGGAVGLALAVWGGAALRARLLPDIQFTGAAGLRVVVFTLGISLLAGVAAGIAPALQATKLDLGRDLASGSRGASARSRLRELLTVGQGAASVLLLVGAGLFVRSVQNVGGIDHGLDVALLVSVVLELETESPVAGSGTSATSAEENALYREALRRVQALPEVAGATVTTSPFGTVFRRPVAVPGWDSLPNLPGGGPFVTHVPPGYFDVVGQGIIRGRDFEATDLANGAPVAVVAETMARTLWPDGDALGACMHVVDPSTRAPSDTCTRVVGVAEDASRGLLVERPHLAYYLPIDQHAGARIRALYTRAESPDAAVPAIGAALRDLGALVRYPEVSTLIEMLAPQARSWSLGASLFSVFGAMALAVAALGLYGVLAFHVAQRTRETSIRSALGATKRGLLGDVLLEGMRLTLIGIVVGLGAAIALSRFAEPLLFEVSARDPGVLVGVAVVLATVGVAASLVPGTRATRTDPMDALRAD